MTGSGHLLVALPGGSIAAQPFDVGTGKISGAPEYLADRVYVSRNGVVGLRGVVERHAALPAGRVPSTRDRLRAGRRVGTHAPTGSRGRGALRQSAVHARGRWLGLVASSGYELSPDGADFDVAPGAATFAMIESRASGSSLVVVLNALAGMGKTRE